MTGRSCNILRQQLHLITETNKKLSCRKETMRLLRGQFWPHVTGRQHFADTTGLSSTTVT